MTDSTLAPAQHLNFDRFAIRSAVTTIRNAFMHANQRQPLLIAPDERRASVRVGLQVPVCVTTAFVDEAEVQVQSGPGSAIEAVSRDISLGGVGFSHSEPLSGDCAIVRFDIPGEDPVCLVVKLVWSNPAADGSWSSGAQILGLTATASESTLPSGWKA